MFNRKSEDGKGPKPTLQAEPAAPAEQRATRIRLNEIDRSNLQFSCRDSKYLAEQYLDWGQKLPSMHSTVHVYPIDGAAHDVDRADTAFSYRDANFAEVIFGVDPDPANAGAIRDWCVGYWDATHPHSAGGAYVNFMMD